MNNPICRACECVAWCSKNGCIPIQPVEPPKDWPVIDPTLIPEKTKEDQ